MRLIDKQQFLTLIDKYLKGEASLEEEQLLNNFINSFHQDAIWDDITEEQKSVIESRMLARLQSVISSDKQALVVPVSRVSFFKNKWIKYAAAVIIMFVTGTLFWKQYGKKPQPVIATIIQKSSDDIEPGKDGAILTLADGSQIILDSLGNRIITAQNGVRVILKSGQLAYQPTGKPGTEITYNTMSTPRGRQFQLLLPDGTKVWLNAASSLRYPTLFIGNERIVEITGEAYFEVAKNSTMPFRIKMNGETQIKVLGTHFNINSYDDEKSINTTLMEGMVEIVNGTSKAVLRPGQQAQIISKSPSSLTSDTKAKNIHIVNNIDLNKVMSWKNGIFDFQNAGLEQVMRQLARWYDLEVIYENGIPEMKFYGKMGRNVSLSKLLVFLRESDLHFRMEEGRKLIVMK
ncbi:MAG: hypothetical protein JWP81_5158 [Ferruginibacter sp.]|nr:hypothetical protein [Ferruginibacter sp.]